MLLQVVSVIVALSGSPVSPQRWPTAPTALGLWTTCRPQEQWIPEGGWPRTEPRFASLAPDGFASPFGLDRTPPGNSRAAFSSRAGTSVGVAASVQGRLLLLDSIQGLEVAATTLWAEREDVATPMRHQREPPRGVSVPHSLPAMPKGWTRSGL